MAESEKGKSDVDPKEKDKDIGKEFLSSWMEDDGMDFGFSAAPSGKKKTFNFDNIDMDFNLDGDFSKFSSFKTDSPGIDFSGSPTKTAKSKKISEDDPSGKSKAKKDDFSFSFDFGLDDFSLETDVSKKVKESSDKNPNSKGAASEQKEGQGLKFFESEVIDDSIILKPEVSESMTSSKVEKQVGAPGPTSTIINDASYSKHQKSASNSVENKMNLIYEETNQRSSSRENLPFTKAQAHHNTQALPVLPVIRNDLNQDAGADNSSEVNVGKHISNGAGIEKNVNKKLIAAAENKMNLLMEETNQKSPARDNLSFSKAQAWHNTEALPALSDGNDLNVDAVSDNSSKVCLEKHVSSGSDLEKNVNKKTVSAVENKKNLIMEESNQKCPSRENLPVTEAQAQHNTQALPVLSVTRTNYIRDSVSDNSSKVCAEKYVSSGSGVEKNINKKLIAAGESNSEDMQVNPSSPSCAAGKENSKFEHNDFPGNAPTEKLENFTEKEQEEANINEDIQNIGPPLVPSTSEPKINMLIPRDKNEAGASFSRFFRRPQQTGSEVLQQPPSQIEALPHCSKRVSFSLPENEKNYCSAELLQVGRKSVVRSRTLPEKLMKLEPVSLGTRKNITSSNNNLKDVNVDGMGNGVKLVSEPTRQDKQITIGKSVTQSSEKEISSRAGPCILSAKATRDLASNLESSHNSDVSFIERRIAGKIAPNLLSLRSLRTTGAQTSPVSHSQQTVTALKRNSLIKMSAPVARSEKQIPPTPSLKRKTFEESNADLASLKPLKRPSQSPKEIRNIKESAIVVEGKGYSQKRRTELHTKNLSKKSPTTRLETLGKVSMIDQQIPSVLENDQNVEKAEEYTRQLDDICNMLKKKNEEAKELLVRAIVNNNKLLMLNHPLSMLDEKIRVVQKFANLLLN